MTLLKYKCRAVVLLTILFTLSIFTGCGVQNNQTWHNYRYDFLGSFDTVISFLGFTRTEEEFQKMVSLGQARFEELHKEFDIYNAYADLNNIYTINEQAGIAPVSVPQDIIDLLVFAKEWQTKIPGQVNIAMGPVLLQWHDARKKSQENELAAYIPALSDLKAALPLTDISKVEIDETAKTVFLKEKGMRLDVGAIAKGYACEIVAQLLIKNGYDSFIISGGGNVRVVGQPKDGRNRWGVGIQNPNGDAQNESDTPLDVFYTKDMSVVTSGDYQRTYVVDGVSYHHLIDPLTLMPATYYRSVTVATQDSGLADYLSTAAFLLPYEESLALITSLEGVEAVWVFADGHMEATDGMKANLKTMGGAVN